MKVTVNLISNVFLAGLISMLPYLSIIRGALGNDNSNSNIMMYLPVMTAPFIVYIISAFGLEIAEQGYKARLEKNRASTVYFIMLVSTIIVPYILAMLTIGVSYMKEISFIVFLLLFIYTFYIFLKGSKISVFFILPLLIYKITNFLR